MEQKKKQDEKTESTQKKQKSEKSKRKTRETKPRKTRTTRGSSNCKAVINFKWCDGKTKKQTAEGWYVTKTNRRHTGHLGSKITKPHLSIEEHNRIGKEMSDAHMSPLQASVFAVHTGAYA